MRRSRGGMIRTLLACVPGKGLETGEVTRWMKSQSGAVMAWEMFCRIMPTSPMLYACQQSIANSVGGVFRSTY